MVTGERTVMHVKIEWQTMMKDIQEHAPRARLLIWYIERRLALREQIQ
jgi:hypothetical protein